MIKKANFKVQQKDIKIGKKKITIISTFETIYDALNYILEQQVFEIRVYFQMNGGFYQYKRYTHEPDIITFYYSNELEAVNKTYGFLEATNRDEGDAWSWGIDTFDELNEHNIGNAKYLVSYRCKYYKWNETICQNVEIEGVQYIPFRYHSRIDCVECNNQMELYHYPIEQKESIHEKYKPGKNLDFGLIVEPKNIKF